MWITKIFILALNICSTHGGAPEMCVVSVVPGFVSEEACIDARNLVAGPMLQSKAPDTRLIITAICSSANAPQEI